MNELPNDIAKERMERAERNNELFNAELPDPEVSEKDIAAVETLYRWSQKVKEVGERPVILTSEYPRPENTEGINLGEAEDH